jgi:mono/diheme cytochrome c family protein
MKVLITVVATIVILVVLGLVFVFSGISNVSAENQDSGLVKWILSAASDNSIERHSKGIEVPALGDSAQVAMGFEHYQEMCVTCHGAPGVDRSEIGKGLNPHAPNLSRSITDLSDAELYWILKNGIKMTGMPSFGKTHSEEQLWAMVSFVKKLPGMTEDQYQAYKAASSEDEEMEIEMEMEEHNHEH